MRRSDAEGAVKPTRPLDLAALASMVGVVVYFFVRRDYGSMPPLPTLAGSTMVLFAAAEVVLGFNLRSRIQRRPGAEPVEALTAAKALLVAKASSLTAAVIGGAWLGVLAYVMPRQDEIDAASDDTWAAAVGVLSSAALVGAALWLEYCCRIPDDPGEQDDGRDDPW